MVLKTSSTKGIPAGYGLLIWIKKIKIFQTGRSFLAKKTIFRLGFVECAKSLEGPRGGSTSDVPKKTGLLDFRRGAKKNPPENFD